MANGRLICFFVSVLLLSLVGCRQSDRDADITMRLYCGAGLRPAVEALVTEFELLASEAKVAPKGMSLKKVDLSFDCDYDGSERLLARMKLSERGDLFLPGSIYYVDLAEENGMVRSKRNVCYFVPTILVQAGNPKKIKSLDDLIKPGIRLGLGNRETCAVGRLSWKIFKKNQIPAESVLENLEFESTTVNELGNQIKLGTLDAVTVWDAVAMLYSQDGGDGSGEIVPIGFEENIVSTVGIGLLKSSEHPRWAEAFVDFIFSDAGRAIWKKYHYTIDRPVGMKAKVENQ
jgi:molybdate transport system substrate-binding protein